MQNIKKNLPWIFRIIISILFLVSAVAKMFPIWAFEKQMVDLGIASWTSAYYLTRFIIAAEIAIGILILQKHYLKKVVIPATIGLLTVFCIHLTIEMVKHGAMNGNCGCFGQLIPMTPLEAFIKNILTIGMLVYVYKKTEEITTDHKFINLVTYYLGSALFMFVFFVKTPQNDSAVASQPLKEINLDALETESKEKIEIQSTEKENPKIISSETKKDTISLKSDKNKEEVQTEKEPKKVKSIFGDYKFTQGGHAAVNVDNGKHVVCMFVPGCDHCRDAAKELKKMSGSKDFPKIEILFMDEETELIPEFFEVTKLNVPYQVIGIVEFWKKLGDQSNTPGVLYLWNGNLLKMYEGTEGNKFNPAELKTIVNKKLK